MVVDGVAVDNVEVGADVGVVAGVDGVVVVVVVVGVIGVDVFFFVYVFIIFFGAILFLFYERKKKLKNKVTFISFNSI